VLFSGSVDKLMEAETATARALRDGQTVRSTRRSPKGFFQIEHATLHNLKDVSVQIPQGVFVCVTGVAGSGKSSLVYGVFCRDHPEAIVVDQGAIGRSSRSNPLTYIGVFDQVRKELAKATGGKPELFSFNSKGACPRCEGAGTIRVDMHFLDEVTMVCEECEGRRYTPEVLSLRYKGKSIADILDMTVTEGIEFFEHKEIVRRLKVLDSVGLGYLQMGQSLSTLSGGEAQRIKLALELQRSGNIYIMDEPTTGLHMADTQRLLGLIDKLVEGGNSVIVIEHNLDVIKTADWLIDLGPDGGSRGGEVIAQGTPEEVARSERSYTARYLRAPLPAGS
jgi:excinuclease ABC A subunit